MSNSQDVKDPIREEILGGAKVLFERFGFKKTTMEDIARAIGKSKSALYYYYKTKEEIFEAVILNDIEISHAQVVEALKHEASAPNKFRIFFTTLLGGVQQKVSKSTIFRSDMYENQVLLEDIVKKRDSYIEELLKNILITGIGQHEVKMMNHAEMDLWAKMMTITLRALAGRIFMDDNYHFSEQQLGLMADMLFNGVSA